MFHLRTHRTERARAAQVAVTACVVPCRERPAGAALVNVEETPSIPSSAMSLPAKAMCSAYWISTAVVLERISS